ncbi:MAG TPA: DUF2339 domain-containing protein, partial [Tepidisphaeraceae bacterium]|nr:DUF2339 domain-containing protein [Tepidisphaeraceae bacterium]
MADDETLARLAALEEQIRQLNQRLNALEQPNPVQFTATPPVPKPPPIVPPIAKPSTPHPAPATPPPIPRRDFEAAIGKKWASWLGALLLLLGVCFFLKYAWDHQWIHPTPMMRLVAAVVMGVFVGLLGEWTYRRKMESLAGACFGAAVAIVMASFFGAVTLFSIAQRPLTPSQALIAVAITTLAGLGISLRASNQTPAVIALIGAYLAPFILNTGVDRSRDFLIYLTLVSTLAWILDLLRPKWIAVRITGLVGAWVAYSVWQSDVGAAHQTLALIFAGIFFVSFLADFCVSGHDFQDHVAILSVINTAFAFSAVYQAFHKTSLVNVGIAALLFALAHAIAAAVMRGGSVKLSSRLQSAALITLAVPLLLNHFAITVTWAVMALVVGILGRTLNLKWVYRWSISLWILAVLHLLLTDTSDHALRATWFSIGDLQISRWLLMDWALAALAQVVANLRP